VMRRGRTQVGGKMYSSDDGSKKKIRKKRVAKHIWGKPGKHEGLIHKKQQKEGGSNRGKSGGKSFSTRVCVGKRANSGWGGTRRKYLNRRSSKEGKKRRSQKK